MYIPDYVRKDPLLQPFSDTISGRLKKAHQKEMALTKETTSLWQFAMGHHYFGLHKDSKHWIIREWAPNAREIFFLCENNRWVPESAWQFTDLGNGCWELLLPAEYLTHRDLYKLRMRWDGGEGDRIPAWAFRVVQDPDTLVFNAQVWSPPNHYQWQHPEPVGESEPPLIYEVHVGMATEDYKVGSWNEFRIHVLPRVVQAGYNTLQMMAVQEHPFYGSFGYHVSSFFASSSRFGTPEELKALIDEAHGMGLRVIMDLVHSHAVKNEVEGISRYDGTVHQFFHDGPRGDHSAWDSRCFDYGKDQVLHFLLSNCRYWLEEFRFDGFRFDGITSMMYLDHGLGTNFQSYQQYYDLNQDEDAMVYLYLANRLIHDHRPGVITIAEEMSGMPGLAAPISLGGLGFDYRMAMGVPDYWIRNLKTNKIEFWHVGEMFHQLTGKRPEEKTVHYAESHDQALVGDKTIAHWLMDAAVYQHMQRQSDDIAVNQGVALHKMIRLITFATAGDAYLNFMGNEFGHPEWIDFPNAHNNWSYHYARRQWSLLDNEELKYAQLAAFDRAMIAMGKTHIILRSREILLYKEHISHQVLIFGRGRLVFVFNFSPFHSRMDYPVHLPAGDYTVLLNTDSGKYGGFHRLDESMVYEAVDHKLPTGESASLYIPALSAFVLHKNH